jgi:hypothetical protein
MSGNVYVDTNQNGVKDGGESNYRGATVALSGAATKSATTNANGNYAFTGLQTGSYIVTLTVPSGFRATTANPVNIPLTDNTTVNFGIVPNTPPSDTTKPGGVWISPTNNFVVTNNRLLFSVHAYDNQGGGGVKEVKFTAFYSGQWHIVHTTTAPESGTDIYKYDWDLSAVPSEPLTVSCDG